VVVFAGYDEGSIGYGGFAKGLEPGSTAEDVSHIHRTGVSIVKLADSIHAYLNDLVLFCCTHFLIALFMCTATNGCGVHIHSGDSFEDSTSQGDNYYEDSVMEDPWVEARYSGDANGKASFSGIVDVGTDDIEGHAFVGKQTTGNVKRMNMFYLSYIMLSLIHQSVHAADGSRVGCGLLTKADGNKLLSTKMEPSTEADVDGRVTVLDLGTGVYFFGLAENLEHNAPNGCGAHIHAGYACDDKTTQGGHFYNNETVPLDPHQDCVI
jgi:hypothetical protein